jgi:hypothetical protein
MELASFKASIQTLNDDELMALLADLRTSRRPISDITEVKERAKPKARSAGSGKASLASLKASLTPDQIAMLIAKLGGDS